MAQQNVQQDINQLLKVRREKLADLQERGRDPFKITKFDVSHHSMEIKENTTRNWKERKYPLPDV